MTELRVKLSSILIFGVKLCFALLDSLRSAIFSQIKADKCLVTLPAGVNIYIANKMVLKRLAILKTSVVGSGSTSRSNVFQGLTMTIRLQC
jgi:hypothetical protein